jgi:DNA-binding CsgD family transcriptional regulator
MPEAKIGLKTGAPPRRHFARDPVPRPPDLIGREREVADLRAIAEGRGAVVLVGESGIGKTALLATATAGLDAVMGGAFGMLGFIPYLPLIRAVGPLPDRDPATVAVTVVERVGDRVLVLDDLHWADDATLAVLDRLTGLVPILSAVRSGDPGTDRALNVIRRAGISEVQVQPLPETDSARLARRWHPGLAPDEARQLVHRAGGNPLLIEELARSGVTTTLTLAIEHRLRYLGTRERQLLELLAVADVPLDVRAQPAQRDRLVRAGLLVDTGHGLAIRHALIGEVIAGPLSGPRRRDLHRRVAVLAPDRATRARHLAAAGDRQSAFRAATAAASESPPGLRAALLGLAAECADGPDAPRLRIEAAEALIAAGLYESADRTLGGDAPPTAELAARRAGVQAQVRWGEGDADGALAAADAGVELAEPGSTLAARLLVDRAWIVTLRREGTRAVELAREALAAARASGGPDAAAQRVLGIAVSIIGADFDEYVGWYRAAADSARRAGDVAEELLCGKLIVASYESGNQAEGIRLAEGFIARAVETGMVALGQTIRSSLVSLTNSHGEPDRAVADGEKLLGESLERRARTQTAGYTALAQVDLGRFDDARRTIAAGLNVAPDDIEGRFDLLWADAELALADGDPARALALADTCLARFGNADYADTTFVRVLRDWACAGLGRDPGPMAEPPPRLHRQHRPTIAEREAIRELVGGAPDRAAVRFVAAAEGYRPYHRRSEIRCRWAAGESLRRSGQLAEAREALELAERLAGERWLPLAGRIRRSLRLAGARRSAPRRASGVLSAREREVLDLVATGLTYAQIAARLGIASRTVARTVSNAAEKLGTQSRAQTALRAAETP